MLPEKNLDKISVPNDANVGTCACVIFRSARSVLQRSGTTVARLYNDISPARRSQKVHG